MIQGRDNNYVNIIINPDPQIVPALTTAVYDDTFNISPLKNPRDYYASIVRFVCPLDTIPLLLFPLNQSQGNPNTSLLVIGIQSGGINYPQTVMYVPNTVSPPPPSFMGRTSFSDTEASLPYYFIFSVTSMINMINTALAAAVTASGIGVAPPFFSYNSVTQLITLNVTAAFIATGANICINTYLINYLNSFNFAQLTLYNYPSPIGFDYQFILNPLPPNSPVGGPYAFVQDRIAMSLWFDLRKIIITSDSLPINPELVPSFQQNGNTTNIAIVTDFAITFDNANDSQTVAIYNPTSQYRLIDLIGDSPLTRFQFQFYWEDKFGTIYPVYLSPLQQASIKLGFFKKDLYNNLALKK